MSFFFFFFKVLLSRRISCRVLFVWRGLSPLPAGVSPEAHPLGPVLVALPCGLLAVPVAEVLPVAWGNFRLFALAALAWSTAGFVLADVLPHSLPLLNFSSVAGRGTRNQWAQCLGGELRFLVLGNGWLGGLVWWHLGQDVAVLDWARGNYGMAYDPGRGWHHLGRGHPVRGPDPDVGLACRVGWQLVPVGRGTGGQ